MKLFASRRTFFSDPRDALDEGIVGVSDDLRVERLLEAYSFGIFPWPSAGLPTLWFSPGKRGVLDFAEFHVPRSLQKFVGKTSFQCTFNQAFEAVITACAALPRPDQSGTWINDRLLRAYREFHRAGYAHSLEVWDGDQLAGGLYGVYVGGVFSGESMFYLQPNASKLALIHLVEYLRLEGVVWMDIQMVTPALKQFGGKYISRGHFLKRLELSKSAAKALAFR